MTLYLTDAHWLSSSPAHLRLSSSPSALQLTFGSPALPFSSSPQLTSSPAHNVSLALRLTTAPWLSSSPSALRLTFSSTAHLWLSGSPVLQLTKAHQLPSSQRLFGFPAHHSSLALWSTEARQLFAHLPLSSSSAQPGFDSLPVWHQTILYFRVVLSFSQLSALWLLLWLRSLTYVTHRLVLSLVQCCHGSALSPYVTLSPLRVMPFRCDLEPSQGHV